MLIDSHCHLDLPPLESQLDSVLTRAAANGVTRMLLPAVDRKHWHGLESLNARPQLDVAIGLHPCFNHQADDLEAMALRLSRPHPYIAIGECGLDKVNGVVSISEQLSLLFGQFELANRYRLPVILHVREAHNELLQLLKQQPLSYGGVVHGFSGSIELAMQYVRHGLSIGVGGVCTYPRAAKTQKMVAQLPLEALLLETDSPDMPVNGFQGLPNEPAQLPLILAKVAELRQQSQPLLAQAIVDNFQRLFLVD